ncbi:MAG TPA: alpha/beta hydrolase [Candidatus Limnocylindria bacterium]|jgi:hypothetical protein|nr:alpha/beta hydrolase [Candidatus Limnocylindria bacterium]
MGSEADILEIRVHGTADLPTLIYLPGLHGDWTLVSSFRAAVAGRVRFVEFNYPRTATWSLKEYAGQVQIALAAHGITLGWILAESFGSQIAWSLLQLGFEADGVILAGGFVRHPLQIAVEAAYQLGRAMPRSFFLGFLKFYQAFARWRHRQAPETFTQIDAFVARRSRPGERSAIVHRLQLIESADFRDFVSHCKVPIYSLVGLWDPVVPWWPVTQWLNNECISFRASRLIWNADHTILATQPAISATQVLRWMGEAVNSRRR